MIFHIISHGDPSVGINGEEATLEINVDVFDGEDREEYISRICLKMKEAFKEIWDDRSVKVFPSCQLDL